MLMKHVIIIGFGPGIGQSLSEKFAHEGYARTLIARSPQPDDMSLNTYDAYTCCDVSNLDHLRDTLQQAIINQGGVDIMIFNAVKSRLGEPTTFSADIADGSGGANTAAFADDAASLNFAAKKDTEVEAATAKKSSSNVRGGVSFFPKKGEPTVTMYFPPSMSFVDNVAYDTNAELGTVGAATLAGMEGGASGFASAGRALMGEGKALLDVIKGGEGSVNNLSEGATDSLKLAVAKVNNRYNPSSAFRNAAALANRFIVNPNVRAIFRGVNIREFQFQFKLIATSPEEARTVQKIIKHFRKELYPRGFPVNFGSASADIGYHFPNAFKIIFKFNGRRNKNLPKIKPAYLRSFNATINPTGGGFRNDGQPNEIDISMAFVEHETLKSLDIKKGF